MRDGCLNINILWPLAQAWVVISDGTQTSTTAGDTPRQAVTRQLSTLQLRHLCHVLQVDGGGCILRAPAGPVDLDRYALRSGLRVDQFECGVRAGGGE